MAAAGIVRAPFQFARLAVAWFGTLVGALAGCDRSSKPSAAGMTTEQLIVQNADTAVDQSITPIASSLATRSVFVPIENEPNTQQGVIAGKLRIKTAKDNKGRIWAYAYTNQAEFSRAFAPGERFAELKFSGFFEMIESDEQFAGIYLNAGSETAYPILRELFGEVRAVLR